MIWERSSNRISSDLFRIESRHVRKLLGSLMIDLLVRAASSPVPAADLCCALARPIPTARSDGSDAPTSRI